MTMREWVKRNTAILWAMVIGAFLFICVYGVHILNPTYVDWMITGGDRPQHYLGWVAYRNSRWFFPIGLTDQLSYPSKTSVIFTDSIPLLAVFFKLFSPLLPHRFQYFGIWGLLTFVLNGAFSAKILQKYMKSDLQVILGSVFYILSFQVLQRMFAHTALAGHWLILWAICLLVYRDRMSYRRKMGAWLSLGAVSSAVHLYLLLMCGIVLLGFLLVEIVEQRADRLRTRFLRTVGYLLSFVGAAAAVIALLGGFSSGMSAVNGGIGAYSLNLNGFINPQWHGQLLRTYTQLDTQHEGFSYLGAGILFMLLCTGIELAVKSNRENIRKYSPLWLGVTLAFCIAFVLAVFPTVTFGDEIIKHFIVRSFMLKVWGTFRASGRIAWICVYLFFLFALCGDYRIVSARRKSMVLAVALILQLVDLSGFMVEKHTLWTTNYTYYPLLIQDNWDTLWNEGEAGHLAVMDDYSMDKHCDLVFWALDRGISVNKFTFARDQGEDMLSPEATGAEWQDGTIYVWDREDFTPVPDAGIYYYDLDARFVVGYTRQIPGLAMWKEG